MSKTTRERLEEQERINALLQQQMQTMMQLVAAQGSQSRTVSIGAQFQQVGIRNVSSYVIGLTSPIKGEPDVQLAAHDWKNPTPASAATISYPFWQMIRSGSWIGRGYIVRDDSVLGDTSLRAPEDRDEDLPAERHTNLVVDPYEWIESRTDDELRAAVAAITSEASIRRLQAAVDQKIFDIGEERYKDAIDRGKRAVRDLPSKFRLVEDLARERLDELMPSAKGRELERDEQIRF